jgi:transcriptional regulator with XRE-family HTH domain
MRTQYASWGFLSRAESWKAPAVITRVQLKMARAALGWGVRDLAKKAGVAATTVSRYENGADAYGETLVKLQRTLEAAGLIFLDENGEGPGVRLKKRPPSRVKGS